MSLESKTIRIATRGSALAMVQAREVQARGKALFPDHAFELVIIKTTGDKLQSASMSNPDQSLPKGLFTKEIEEALLDNEADLAVHSLKDLPTSLPDGLKLGATLEREDVRDVLVFKVDANFSKAPISQLKHGAVVATSSTRRKAQLLHRRPDLSAVEIRGNVGTRLRKLAEQDELDATILAAAGLSRLGYSITQNGALAGEDVPAHLCAIRISLDDVLPCVGQGAIGLEIRDGDARLEIICAALNHDETWRAVIAERAFLRGIGGGCQAPVAAFAQVQNEQVQMKVVSFLKSSPEFVGGANINPDELGQMLAKKVTE